MYEELIYLDHAAATPVDPLVLEAMLPYFSEMFFNPSSPYVCGIEVKREYREAKHRIAVCLGAQMDELVMTAGATESINIALTAAQGVVLVSSIEHASVIAAAGRVMKPLLIPASAKGYITADAVANALTPEVTMVSVGLVNAEVGTIQPIEEIARVIEAERQRRRETGEATPLLFHTDASQAAALLDIKVKRLGVDLLTLGAAKVYGPKQVGLLWVRPGVNVQPTVVGGGQEAGLRSGTENVAGVVAFAVALEVAAKRRRHELKRLRQLRDELEGTLVETFSEMIVSSDRKKGLANFLHVSFPGLDAERLVFLLESVGVMVATGSACAANKGKRSRVLQALGMTDREIDGSVRITLGRLSTPETTRRAADLLVEAIHAEYARVAK